jgi:dTDP-4-amino-4,6-dideoxygalactose transaminase
MYANLFGHVIDYDRFQVHTSFLNSDVVVIEDAAQSFGARYKDRASGSLGNISVLSFDPTKNLNNYGSGGMILTDNETYYEILQDLKDNGKPSGHHFRGTNSKMSEVDCAQMLIKLKYFDHWQQRRQDIANYYTDCLSAYVDVVLPGPDVTSAWSKYVIRTMGRDNLRSHLSSRGIETRATYSAPLFDHPVGYGYANFAGHHFDQSIKFSRECLSLPIYPELTDSEVEFVANSVKEFLIK